MGSVSRNKKVIWSSDPSQKQFLVGGQDLRLYKYSGKAHHEHEEFARLKGILMDHSYMKCFAWDSKNDIVALGYTTGKTILTKTAFFDQLSTTSSTNHPSLPNIVTNSMISSVLVSNSSSVNGLSGGSTYDSSSNILASFLPKHSRACNVVSFCPTQSSFLLCGLDKVRSDFCLNVYDVERATCSPVNDSNLQKTPFISSEAPTPSRIASSESLDEMAAMADLSIDSFGDKQKSTSSILNEIKIYNSQTRLAPSTPEPPSGEHTPIYSLGLSESVNSADWMYSGTCIAAGMGYRFIRIYDLRANDSSANNINLALSYSTRAVFNIVADPFNPFQFASVADDAIVRVWDVRKPSEPALTFQTEYRAGINQISWSPTNNGLLAVSGKDSNSVKIWHVVSDSTTEVTEQNPSVVIDQPCIWKSRQATPSSAPVQAFSWIPTSSNTINRIQMMTMHGKDDRTEFLTLHEHPRVTWNPSSAFLFSYENEWRQLAQEQSIASHISTNNHDGEHISDANSNELEDISKIMMRRASMDYSLEMAHSMSNILGEQDHALKNMWSYFVKAQVGRIGGVLGSGATGNTTKHTLNATWFHGIASTVFEMKGFSSQASPFQSRRPGSASNEGSENGDVAKKLLVRYQHKTRQDALEMCGWGIQYFDSDESFVEEYVNRLEKAGEIEKAAYFALFLLSNTVKALQILQSSQNQQLVLIAATLAGFVEMQYLGPPMMISPWKSICKGLSQSISDPHLKAIFTLIASEGDVLKVLSITELSLSSRLAIALKYLDDEQLRDYMELITSQVIEQGNIEGLLLTGLNPNAVNLFAKYVDQTGDIQTSSIVLSIVVPRSFTDTRVEQWVESYRELLDCWELYHIRAKFDIFRRRYMGKQGVQSVPAQMCIRCNYCNMTINRGFSAPKELSYAGAAANMIKPKMTSCPHCRKPLPRCAICLLHMGTPTDLIQFGAKKGSSQTSRNKLSTFDLWFTWCQNCKHGGHARHILDWFSKHNTCPVSGCDCKCSIS